MLKRIFICLPLIALFSCATPQPTQSSTPTASKQSKDYQEYLTFFEKVYAKFEENYYLHPDRATYNHFIDNFNTKIYAQLKGEGKSDDYVRWRSAWYLVDMLKSKEDKFSQFYPPKPAESFKKEALGQQIDLGIEGKKVDQGFIVTRMEPRSDSYAKGLREDDIITFIDGADVKPMTQEEVQTKLKPLAGTKAKLVYISHEDKLVKTIMPESKEFFIQTVFMHRVDVPGVFCLEIPRFDRMTGEDLYRFLKVIEVENPKGLVLDLRGNPGGPPLAAREIASFFLKGGEEFAYFQKREETRSDLDVPTIDEHLKFHGPIVILVDEHSGSAAELFTGVMQFRNRAAVIGTNTAGQVLLKSMFPLEDGSMVALVTAPGYLPDGTRFSFNGITPDKVVFDAPKDGLINLAAAYIVMQTQQR